MKIIQSNNPLPDNQTPRRLAGIDFARPMSVLDGILYYNLQQADLQQLIRSLLTYRKWFAPLDLFTYGGTTSRQFDQTIVFSPERVSINDEVWIFTHEEAARRAAHCPFLGTFVSRISGTELFRVLPSKTKIVRVNPHSTPQLALTLTGDELYETRYWTNVTSYEGYFAEWEKAGKPDQTDYIQLSEFYVFDHSTGPVITLPNRSGLSNPAAAFTAPDCASEFLSRIDEKQRGEMIPAKISPRSLLAKRQILGIDGLIINLNGPGAFYALSFDALDADGSPASSEEKIEVQQLSSGELFWKELVVKYGPPIDGKTLSPAELKTALAGQRVLRFGRKGDGYGSGDVFVYLAKTVEDATQKLDDNGCLWVSYVFSLPCRLTEEDAERLNRNMWESYGDVHRATEAALKDERENTVITDSLPHQTKALNFDPRQNDIAAAPPTDIVSFEITPVPPIYSPLISSLLVSPPPVQAQTKDLNEKVGAGNLAWTLGNLFSIYAIAAAQGDLYMPGVYFQKSKAQADLMNLTIVPLTAMSKILAEKYVLLNEYLLNGENIRLAAQMDEIYDAPISDYFLMIVKCRVFQILYSSSGAFAEDFAERALTNILSHRQRTAIPEEYFQQLISSVQKGIEQELMIAVTGNFYGSVSKFLNSRSAA